MRNPPPNSGDLTFDRRCGSCGSEYLDKFLGEIAIHFPGLEKIDMPVVWVFPELLICLSCGSAQFAVPETELRQLLKGKAAGQ
jgi:hypothetical protein